MKLAWLSSFVVLGLLCQSVLCQPPPNCLACDEAVPAPSAVATSNPDTPPVVTATDRNTDSIATASVDYFGHAHLNSMGGGGVSDGEHTLADARPEMQVNIIQFNDIYQNEARKQEPSGGVAHALTAVNRCGDEAALDGSPPPLVIFSGDCLGPSSLSTVTQGAHMIEALNLLGVDAAVPGNHDFDFGVDTLMTRMGETEFPWVLSNAFAVDSGLPLAGCRETVTMDYHGIKIGLIGLIEKDWLNTLSAVPSTSVDYHDFVEVGRAQAQRMRANGVDLVVAMTHMRSPNDEKLAREVPDIDIILGGHDHHYMVKKLGDVWLCKSGTNMRDLTEIRVTIPAAAAGEARERPTITTKRIPITSDIPPHKDGMALVAKYNKVMNAKMGDVIATTPVLLDGFSNHIRAHETNLGNLVCDALREHMKADIALVQAGTFRGDDVLGPTILMKDLFSMFPYTDTVVSKLVPGRTLVAALEAGVSRIPAHEGCFPQVSGIRFRFDPAKPPFSRIESPVLVGDEELDMEAMYTVVMPAYIGRGKDGYAMLGECEYVGGSEDGPALKDVLRAYFSAQPGAVNVERTSDNNSSDSAAPRPTHQLQSVLDGRISQASLVASSIGGRAGGEGDSSQVLA